MQTISHENSPANVPSKVDRNDSPLSERVAMWLLGVALLAICLVAASIAFAHQV